MFSFVLLYALYWPLVFLRLHEIAWLLKNPWNFSALLAGHNLIALMEAKQAIYFSLQCVEPSTLLAFKALHEKPPQVDNWQGVDLIKVILT